MSTSFLTIAEAIAEIAYEKSKEQADFDYWHTDH
jgi:hypothetical protein